MSLSRLPQVALRRLMPAISAVPKSLDDDQIKKILDPQNQQQQFNGLLTGKTASNIINGITPTTSTQTQQQQQGILSLIVNKGNYPSSNISPSFSHLLATLSDAHNGALSTQDLALLDSNAISDSLLTTPEPSSPSSASISEDLLLTETHEPNLESDALDPASMDALVSAMRGTAAISSLSSLSEDGNQHNSTSTSTPTTTTSNNSNKEESKEALMLSSEAATANADHMSAAERRKEQNRRAQKKFRQKDKVRQKEIKWRASQYEDLVETNKRFKRDIDSISQERDMYRRILEQNGIKISDDTMKIGNLVESKSSSNNGMAPMDRSSLSTSSSTTVVGDNSSSAEPVAAAALSQQPMISSAIMPTTSSPPMASFSMDQIAQDTFGTMELPQPITSAPSTAMNDLLLDPLMWGSAVKADPMFGNTTTTASAAPSVGDPSSHVVDHHVVDAQFAEQHGMTTESSMVDPMAFIDELLATPNGYGSSVSPLLPSNSLVSADTNRRKRSFEETLF